MNHDAIHPFAVAEPEVQSAIVLARESHSAVDDPALSEISRLHDHLGADCAAIAPCADEVKRDPVIRGVGRGAIQDVAGWF